MADTLHAAKRRLADTLLPGGLYNYVSSRRTAGQSWRLISLAIREEIELDVHPTTLRLWLEDSEQPTAAAS